MKIFRYGLLGLFAFLLFLLLLAPASLVTDWIGQRLTGFKVQTVEGAATDGVAQGLQWRGARIEKLSWGWRPLALATGSLKFSLNVDDPDLKLTGTAATGWDRHWRFQALAGQAPLAKLYVLAGQSNLPAQGVVELKLRELRLNAAGWPVAADGVVHLRNLRTTLGQALTLGDFTAQVTTADPAGIQGKVQDDNGPLVLEGAFSLLPDGRYRFNGQAAVRDASNQPLRQAMNLLGPPGSDGRWALNFSGVLAL
ncbi:MAG: type II secretion system protein N [Candidatus Competibacteraceae bacterium]